MMSSKQLDDNTPMIIIEINNIKHINITRGWKFRIVLHVPLLNVI